MRHGSPRLDRVTGRFCNRLSERKHHTTEISTRRRSGVLAGRRLKWVRVRKQLNLPIELVIRQRACSPRIELYFY
jgi:hypothetical protein